ERAGRYPGRRGDRGQDAGRARGLRDLARRRGGPAPAPALSLSARIRSTPSAPPKRPLPDGAPSRATVVVPRTEATIRARRLGFFSPLHGIQPALPAAL